MHDLRTGKKPDEVAREKGHDDIANDILAYPNGPFEAISEQMDTDAAAAREAKRLRGDHADALDRLFV